MIQLGVALGSGGARGLAHVGILSVLQKEKLSPACIAGTSMGAIVGALYAENLNADTVAEKLWSYLEDPKFKASWAPFAEDEHADGRHTLSELLRTIHRKILTFKTFTSPSQYSPERLLEPLQNLFKSRDIVQLGMPFAAVAVDLLSGGPRVFKDGNLVNAVYASSAIPGVFPPLRLGGELLVDGGGPFHVPVDVCRELGADFVLAVDIPSFAAEDVEYKTGMEILMRSDEVARRRLNRMVLRDADLVVRPDVERFHWTNFAAADAIREEGESAMRKALPELRRRLRERKRWSFRLRSTVNRLLARGA